MKRVISIILTLMMLMSMVSVSFVTTSAATTDRLPFAKEASVSSVLTKFVPYSGSSVKYYKLDGSGDYIKSSDLKETKFSSSYQYPYVIQGATAFGGAYYFAATYQNANALTPYNYQYGYIVKYVVEEKKHYISEKLPIGHGNCFCYNPDKNWILVANNSPDPQKLTIIDAKNLTYVGQIDVGSTIGGIFAVQYNRETKRYVICCSGESTNNYIITISDDLKMSVISSYKRSDLNQDTSKDPCYLKQGLYATPDYLLYPFSRKPVGDGPNIIRVTDWEGNFIQDIEDPHEKEIEDIMADEDGYIYFVYHDNSARGAVYQAKMTAYTVKYLPNGGTGTMADSEHYYGTSSTLSANKFTRSGYTFKGWHLTRKSDGKALYKNKSGTTTWFTPGQQEAGYFRALYSDKQSVSALAHKIFDEVYCEAQWGASSGYYSIFFDPNGGDTTMDVVLAKDGSKITLPENAITRRGYKFAGWKAYRHYDNKWNYTTKSSGSTAWRSYTTSSSYTQTIYQPGQSVSALGYSGKKDRIQLVCQWEELEGYTVKFNANGGSGSMNAIQLEADASQALPTNTFTKTGYTFAGWKAPDGTIYQDKASIKNLAEAGEEVTLTAQWKANTYTVKFNANGGSGTMADMSMTYDKSATLTANTFTKTGYTFAGWTNGSTTYTDAQSVKNLATSGTVTLTAKWTASNYTIKFNANGGTGTMADMAMTYDTAKNLTANAFTKTGYTFAGWTAGGKTYADKTEVKNLATSGTVTFTANWTANTYTVKFDANGGSGTMADMSMTYDTAKALTANTFTRTGYTFAGWTNGSTTYTDAQSVKNLATIGTVTLTAKWTANKYTVKFDANGGVGSMSDMTMTYDTAKALATNTFTREDYKFVGWLYNGTIYDDGQSVKNLATSGTVTLKAQWTSIKYTINFKANGGAGTMADVSAKADVVTSLPANAFTKENYTFNGWKTSDGTVYKDKAEVVNLPTENGVATLTAQWIGNEYTISYDANGGSGTMADLSMRYDTAKSLTTNRFTKTGYTFAGWKYGDTVYTDGQTVKNLATNGTVTLVAQWKANAYTVKFDANGGSGTMSSMTMTYDVAKNLTTNGFTRTGYTFAGWANGSKTYTDGQSVKNLATNGTVTLTAQWKANTYTVKFDANSGSGTMSDMTMTYGTGKALATNGFTKTGYTLVGWTLDGYTYDVNAVVNNLTATENGVVTLKAEWVANTYTVKFAANGGSGTMSSMTMTYDVAKNLTANGFTRTGYTFAGWTNGSKTYTDGQSVKNLATSGTVTLTAQWTVNTYTVKFDANGGTGTMSDLTMTYGTGKALTPNAFTKDGYKFLGWEFEGYTYSDNAVVNNLTATNNGVVTLKALWGVPEYRIKFDANGGNGTMADQIADYDVDVVLNKNTFTRTGYTFAGWTDGANTYADKQTVKNLTTTSITLKAVWTPITYTIKFDAGTGTGTMSSMTLAYGEEKNLTLNTFTHATKGQGFVNWKDSSGKTYENGEAVKNLTTTNGATITLTAQWAKVKYTVKFDANGGTGTMADQSMTYGVKAYLSDNKFTRSGYSFMGWHLYRKSDGKRLYKHYNGDKTWFVCGEQTKGYAVALYSDEQSVSELSASQNDEVTLKAQWKPKSTGNRTYYLRFDANGGEGEMEDFAVRYKTSTPLPENTITRKGYKFLGWAAHRLSDDKWRFQKSGGSASFADYEDRTSSSYSLYLYQPGEKVSTTSSKDRDIIEMICMWEYVGE